MTNLYQQAKPSPVFGPVDLDGKPYTPVRSYSWLTPEGRADLARQFDCDPAEVEYRMDARDGMDAYIAEHRGDEFPYTHRRAGARPLTYAEKVFSWKPASL